MVAAGRLRSGHALHRRTTTVTGRCATAAAAAAACSCRRSRSGSGTTSAATGRSRRSRAILRRAFDLGVTHFDLANNYGPPFGSAEENFGRILRDDLAALPRRAGHLDQGRLRHVARARTASGARASTCSPASTRASRAWASTTSTSSTRTASTPRRRSRRRWARSTRAVRSGKALLRRHLVLLARADARGGRDPRASSARRCSSTSRRTRCSTAGSRTELLDALDGARRRLHRLLAARAGAAHRQVPGRHPGRTRAPPRAPRSRRDLLTEETLGADPRR